MSAIFAWTLAVVYFVAINVLTFLTFWIDKERAQMGGRDRVPENTLLLLAGVGGALGAFYARRKLRHKTRKQPFSAILLIIATFQIIVVFGLLGWFDLLSI